MLFPEVAASCDKEILKYVLLHCPAIRMSSKSVSQIFKILFQIGDINIFVLPGICFSGSTKKAPFLKKTISMMKSEKYFSREVIKV